MFGLFKKPQDVVYKKLSKGEDIELNLVKKALDSGMDVNVQLSQTGRTLLKNAFFNNNEDVQKFLLGRPDLNINNSFQYLLPEIPRDYEGVMNPPPPEIQQKEKDFFRFLLSNLRIAWDSKDKSGKTLLEFMTEGRYPQVWFPRLVEYIPIQKGILVKIIQNQTFSSQKIQDILLKLPSIAERMNEPDETGLLPIDAAETRFGDKDPLYKYLLARAPPHKEDPTLPGGRKKTLKRKLAKRRRTYKKRTVKK